MRESRSGKLRYTLSARPETVVSGRAVKILKKAPQPQSLLIFSKLFLIAALGAHAVFVECNSAQRATVDIVFGFVFLRSSVYAARESELNYIQLVF